MSITQALANATSGLNAASRRAGVVSNNIANALTPGFARREVSLGERTIAGGGAGVAVNGINRSTAPALTAARREIESQLSGNEIVNTAQQSLARLVGGVSEPGSVFTRFETLDAALVTLSNTPESTSAQRNVLTAANDIVATFRTLSTTAQNLADRTSADIAGTVGRINDQLSEIAELNNSIEVAVVNGRDFAAFVDRRDVLIDGVAREIALDIVPDRNGRVDLITDEGVFLTRGTPRELSLQTAINPETGQPQQRLFLGETDITPGLASQGVSEGRLSGLFEVLNDTIPTFQGQIDGLADDLIGRFADRISADGIQGDLALFVDSAGEGAPVSGAAARLNVNAAVDPAAGGILSRLRDGFSATTPGAPGNNANPVTLLEAFREVRPGLGGSVNGGATDLIAEFTTLQASAALSSESSVTTARAQFESLSEQELNQIGVNTDDELRSLIEIEQAFAANARVIEVADRLVQQLLEI